MFKKLKLKNRKNKFDKFIHKNYKGSVTFEEMQDIDEEWVITCIPVLFKLYNTFEELDFLDKFNIYLIRDDNVFGKDVQSLALAVKEKHIDFTFILKLVGRINVYYHLSKISLEDFTEMIDMDDFDESKNFVSAFITLKNDYEYDSSVIDDYRAELRKYLGNTFSSIEEFYEKFKECLEDEHFTDLISGHFTNLAIKVFSDKEEAYDYRLNYNKRIKLFDEFAKAFPNGLNGDLVAFENENLELLKNLIEAKKRYNAKMGNDTSNEDDEIDYSKLN